MKLGVLTGSISRSAGGLQTSVRRLSQALAQSANLKVEVFSFCDENAAADLKCWYPLDPVLFAGAGPHSFRFCPALTRAVIQSNLDLIHTHGLWLYLSHVSSHFGKIGRAPYVISPRGMLDAWALQRSRWKKRVAGWLFENENLRRAGCIHALCQPEAQSIRVYGLKNPICIIPNGIDLPILGNAETLKSESGNAPWAEVIKPGRKILLYLGRIHPKKGLVNLLKAWAAVGKTENGKQKAEEWVLAIAGWDQGGHEAELKQLATELEIAWADVRENLQSNSISPFSFHHSSAREMASPISPGSPLSSDLRAPPTVLFLGPQFNDAKSACYASCDAFILPSFSEGLPMVVLEAWAHGKPVLMTPECNLPEGFAANAAIRIETNVESIVQGLQDLFRLPSADLSTLGANGLRLVSQRFAWPKIAVEMKSVYDWVLGGGAKPGCVV
jgi:poly(glycerol-phosphate) alpha-glucosyltransferase